MKRLKANEIERLENTSIASTLVAAATADALDAGIIGECDGDTCVGVSCVAASECYWDSNCHQDSVCHQDSNCHEQSVCQQDSNCGEASVCVQDSNCGTASCWKDSDAIAVDGMNTDLADAVRAAIE